MDTKTTVAWIAYDEEGCPRVVGPEEDDAQVGAALLAGRTFAWHAWRQTWERLVATGWRCVRVRITET